MLKRTLQAPPQENGAIDGYTSELSRLLRPALSGERADEIVNEAQAHLYDRADALATEENVSQAEAETRAVAAFTPAVQFAREMAQSAFETGHSKAWRTMGRAVAAGFLTSLLFLLVASTWMNGFIVGASCLFLACIAVCAFQARRAQTRQYAIWGAVATLLSFLYAGFFYLDGAPTDESWTQGNRYALQSAYTMWHTSRLKSEAYVRFLETGKRVYQSPNPVVPAELKGPNGVWYCVPFNGSLQPYHLPDNVETPRTVATMEEAKALWQATGPEPLARARQLLDSNRHYEEPLRIALQQRGFAKTAWWYAMVMAGFGAWLVTLDWLFAKMGRAAFSKHRDRHVKRA